MLNVDRRRTAKFRSLPQTWSEFTSCGVFCVLVVTPGSDALKHLLCAACCWSLTVGSGFRSVHRWLLSFSVRNPVRVVSLSSGFHVVFCFLTRGRTRQAESSRHSYWTHLSNKRLKQLKHWCFREDRIRFSSDGFRSNWICDDFSGSITLRSTVLQFCFVHSNFDLPAPLHSLWQLKVLMTRKHKRAEQVSGSGPL